MKIILGCLIATLASLTFDAANVAAQPAACHSSTRKVLPITDAKTTVAPAVGTSANVRIAATYFADLKLASTTFEFKHFDSGGLHSTWATYDQALLALLIGVSSPVELVADSVATYSDTSHKLFLSLWCVNSTARTHVGSYWIRVLGDSTNFKFRTALVDFALQRAPVQAGSARIFTADRVILNTARIIRSLALMKNIATEMQQPLIAALDVVVTSTQDTTLALLGIFEWNDPISEYTSLLGFSALSVVVDRYNGDISMHELIHVATARAPMHPLILEGLAVYLSGVNGLSYEKFLCQQSERLKTLRNMGTLVDVIKSDGGTGVTLNSKELAAFGGLLAKVLLQRKVPQGYWRLSPEMLSSEYGKAILKNLETEISEVLVGCAER